MKQNDRTASVPQIHKFRGALLANADAVVHALSIVKNVPPLPPVVVVSAMGGVTDFLLALAEKYPAARL